MSIFYVGLLNITWQHRFHFNPIILQQVIEGADERMKTLENQWVEHKTPLLQQIEQLRIQANNRQATIEQKLAELQEFKQQMKSSSDEARKKDELIKSLVSRRFNEISCERLEIVFSLAFLPTGGSTIYTMVVNCVTKLVIGEYHHISTFNTI